jgi:glycosyltransferase involved in cell wall biosynthesis
VACWFWELEVAPADWRSAVDDVDVLVLASPFMVRAFTGFGVPCVDMPVPVESRRVAHVERAHFSLPEDAFVFLAALDFNSVSARKNPVAAIAAFRRAFPATRTDVCLAMKCSNARAYPSELASLVRAASGDPRITIIDTIMSDIEVAALRQCADAFVSLHRAEGFGLMIAECMALAMPVVATAWSGNLAFMTAENSLMVDFKLVPVPSDAYPHAQGQWAEPDIGHAAAVMQQLVDDPALAARIGAQAAADIESQLSPRDVGMRLASELAVRSAALTPCRDRIQEHQG